MEDENKPFAISKVRISGFKKIRNPFELTFNDLVTILVGENGTGKSTIVEAINLALSGRYRDAPIGRSVSEYLFNKDDVPCLRIRPNHIWLFRKCESMYTSRAAIRLRRHG